MKSAGKKIIIVAGLARSLLNFRLQLLLEFKKHGLDVLACAPDEDPIVLKELSKYDIAFIKISLNNTGLNPINDIFAFSSLLALFKKHKPDIVLSYALKPLIYGSLAAYFAGVPEIIPMNTGLGFVFIGQGFLSKFLAFFIKKACRFVFKHSRVVLFQNSDILNVFIAGKLVSKNKAVLINGSGVDIEYFSLKPLSSKPIFLMIARLLKDKGLLEYFAAAKIIKGRYPEISFKLVGYVDGNPNSIRQSKLDELLADNNVEFLGKLDDVRDVISASSIYVLPSYCEGMPRSVLEAMSMGRPIITTDAPGCRDTVVDGINGYLVPIKNITKLVESMEKFILYPELIARMGAESRKIAEDKYDVHKVNQVILRALHII